MQPIYLDHNATTPLLPEAAEAMAECYRAGAANPASQHAAGRRARQLVEEARETIGRILGARVDTVRGDRVIFTSGGTEANNLAIFGLMAAKSASPQSGSLVISAIEHPSVVGPAERLVQQGHRLSRLGALPNGVVDAAALPAMLAVDTRLVSVMLGNNETGVLQPVAELAATCSASGVPMHTDAVQVVGKLPVDFHALGVAALSCSAHKFHGPVGIGALLVRHDVELLPHLAGGFQQAGERPGTESVALVVGMRVALEAWHLEHTAHAARMTELRTRFERALQTACPNILVHGTDAPRLPHTSAIAFPGLDRQMFLLRLDLAGVACSTGSACASGSSEPSPTLLAMGLSKPLVEGSLRFSIGRLTTPSEVDDAARRIVMVYNDLQSMKSDGKMPPAARSAGPNSL